MNYRRLGKTGLTVSEIGVGCWAYGGVGWGPVDDADSISAIRCAYDLGVRFFDTADSYGAGHSEEVLAAALEGARPDAVICTKSGILADPSRQEFSYAHLATAIEGSLRRLRRERVDLYLLHNPDRATLARGEAFDAMERLQREGKVAHWGVSVRPAASWRSPPSGASEDPVADAAVAVADDRVAVIEIVYNMLEADAAAIFTAAAERDVGIVARVPLASGLLAGRFTRDTTFPRGDFRRRWPRGAFERDLEAVARIRALPQMDGRDLAQAALQFAIADPAVSVTIPGARNAAQAAHNLAPSKPFSPSEVAQIVAAAKGERFGAIDVRADGAAK
jgi:aryl-alcohol dehydrogenase-like predicted oxidoreductase